MAKNNLLLPTIPPTLPLTILQQPPSTRMLLKVLIFSGLHSRPFTSLLVSSSSMYPFFSFCFIFSLRSCWFLCVWAVYLSFIHLGRLLVFNFCFCFLTIFCFKAIYCDFEGQNIFLLFLV